MDSIPFRTCTYLASSLWFEKCIYRLFKRFEYPPFVVKFFQSKRHRVVEQSAHCAEYIFANSQYTAQLLEDIGISSTKIQITVGGVDSSKFTSQLSSHALRETLEIPKDRFVILTVCRLVMKKGIDFLLKHLDQLVESMPDIHLVIIGSGPKEKKLRRLATLSRYSDHISFIGSVAQEQIHHYYSIADAFVLASRIQYNPLTGLTDAETMGRVLCEANAATIPVLAANSGGIPSVIQHRVNGLLFTTDCFDSFYKNLCELRENKAQTSVMRQNGKQLATSQFDWKVIVSNHEKYFAHYSQDKESMFQHVRIQIVEPCRAKCVWCATHKKNPTFRSLRDSGHAEEFHTLYKDLIKAIQPEELFISGGEPLLYKDIQAFLNEVSPYVSRIHLFTSYQFTKRVIDSLSSMNLPSQKLVLNHTPIYFEPHRWHKLTQGFPFEVYIENIRKVVTLPIKKRFKFIINHSGFVEEIQRFQELITPNETCEISLKVMNDQGNGLSKNVMQQTASRVRERIKDLDAILTNAGWSNTPRPKTSIDTMREVIETQDVNKCPYRNEPLELRLAFYKGKKIA